MPPPVQAPRFEVDPLWPKPLPNQWILGQTIGVSVDAQDHVWIIHRAGSLEPGEVHATTNPPTAQCCAPAPPVLEFDAAGNLIGHWGGPGQGYDWPDSNHGITVDYKGNVWIGGNGRGSPPARGADAGAAAPGAGQNRQQDESQTGGTQSFNDNMVLKFTPGRQIPDADREAGTEQGQQRHREPAPAGEDVSSTSRPTSSTSPTATATTASSCSTPTPASTSGTGAPTATSPTMWTWDGTIRRRRRRSSSATRCTAPISSVDRLLYVCDRVNDRIQVFKPDGTFVKEAFFNKETLGSGSAWDIAFSKDPQQKYIYLADGEDDKVLVILRETLEDLTSFGEGGRQPGEFYGVHSIATDSKGNIYTTETYRGQRVQKFVYKGLAPVTKKDQGVVWPARPKP